jgi:hypothetical protein
MNTGRSEASPQRSDQGMITEGVILFMTFYAMSVYINEICTNFSYWFRLTSNET